MTTSHLNRSRQITGEPIKTTEGKLRLPTNNSELVNCVWLKMIDSDVSWQVAHQIMGYSSPLEWFQAWVEGQVGSQIVLMPRSAANTAKYLYENGFTKLNYGEPGDALLCAISAIPASRVISVWLEHKQEIIQRESKRQGYI